ncbi:Serine/threonine-protein kinase gad8 [Neolecta irregularis DAH-3]|uniref:Serine/threonine-protein kinase gad8 n=1 Tax=Neolecta irregularis (strain DAH-3) TaxID=1198029 RepID=A0A1U7LJF5_NEOID|nr:Serine/threonine-protein kinase gad8 [Neolecta irregularis DAH-3]|eukprot:OLL22790.1 Serine/threonine-protein kinase gad8 [Neolecta irregularis DAH-3]
MSWKLTKKFKEATSLSPAPASSRSSASSTATITPSTHMPLTDSLNPGLLSVGVLSAKGLTLPPGIEPPARPSSSSSFFRGHQSRSSRQLAALLPYVVMEFDKNEVLVDAIKGSIQEPEWGYTGSLYDYI